MTKYNVIDSIMGSGKSSYCIQYVNEAPDDERFIYIALYNDEVKRFKDGVTNRVMHEPTTTESDGRKLTSLKRMIEAGLDIVTTHALLSLADSETIELLRQHNYHLIVDEVLDVIQEIPEMKKQDIDILKNKANIIETDNLGNVKWLDESIGAESMYSKLYYTAKAGTLFISKKETFSVRLYNRRVLESFETVTVCSYLFKYSQLCAYYRMFDVNYDIKSVKYDWRIGKYTLCKYDPLTEDRNALYELMDIYEGKYNDNLKGQRLSAKALRCLENETEVGKDVFDTIARNIRGFFRMQESHKVGDVYWATLKDVSNSIGARRSMRDFKSDSFKISINAKATNKYKDALAIAYVYDIYQNVTHKQFFEGHSVAINEDGWSVSEILQLIYRSRIRDGEKVSLYIPSARMRRILNEWANYEL
ncbi:hypothetical protein ETI10_03735 [Macrococcoides goetzii]|nr:hypothetical protein [Macrococcus goetzii]TDM42217.1 hypothetical protein ETI10_03735 [Macrococcus goetzii]